MEGIQLRHICIVNRREMQEKRLQLGINYRQKSKKS